MGSEQLQSGGELGTAPAWSDDGLLDQIDTAIYAVNGEGRCRRFNRAAERLFGFSQTEMLGRNVHETLHSHRPDGSPYPQDECTLVGVSRAGKSISSVREVMWARSGEPLPVECSVAQVVMDGEPGAVITAKDLRPQHRMEATLQSMQDETAELFRQRDAASRVERELAMAESIRHRELTTQVERTAASKLREQQDLLDQVVQAAPVGIAVLGPDLRLRWHNRAYAAIVQSTRFGLTQTSDSFQHVANASQEIRQIVKEVRETGNSFMAAAYPYDLPSHGCTYWTWSLTRLAGNDLLLTAHNVTEQTLSQRALVESDKMAAVGRLAASISHEINNPLEAVTNLLYLVHSDAELSDESRSYVAMAEEELARVSRIASQTLRFHRHAPEAIDRTPQQLVDPVLALYEGKLKSTHVRVSVDFDSTGPVKTFEGDVRQILNNLIGNAIDAMQRGGELRVRTRPAQCVRTGRRGMRITIADTGHGMSPETAAHIFEPFYTTKGAAGSGLGLLISHTLAERPGGKLQVRSSREGNRLGKPAGTAFSLFLPSQEPAATTLQ